MELRHLRYFVAVAEELNVRRASKRLFMEQPSLSRQIQELEREVGVLLFRRVKRRIELTHPGEVFLEEARYILAQVEQAVQATRLANQQERQSLRIGACFGLTRYSHTFDTGFAQIVRTFRERHPDIGLMLGEVDALTLQQGLSEGKFDLGFSNTPATNTALIHQNLFREPLVLVLPQEHPLSALPEVPLRSLHQENLFLFPEEVAPTFHQEILSSCEKAGFRPKSVQSAESLQKALWLVGAGLGVTFVGASLEAIQPYGVTLRSVRNFTSLLEFSAIWRQDDNHPFLREFVDLAKGIFQAGGKVT